MAVMRMIWLTAGAQVHDNAFPFFPAESGRQPAPDAKADLVRFEFDLSQPTGTQITKTKTILDFPGEFPRVDERFLGKKYDVAWLNVMTPAEYRDPAPEGSADENLVWAGLDGVAQHHYSTGKTEYYYAGRGGLVQEPVFVPRSDSAPEGDGWVIFLCERRITNLCEIIVLDTRTFSTPVAVIKLPLHIKAQVHGNWIDQKRFKERKSLVREGKPIAISGRGALETGDI